MTFKRFLYNIEKIYTDEKKKSKSERLRYGQIIMNELWDVWPQKYRQIAGSDKDPFYCDIEHKKPYDLLNELEKEWPVFPEQQNENRIILTNEQKFVIFWLYNRVAERMPSNPIKGGGNDIVVDGINVTETIRELLKGTLFV